MPELFLLYCIHPVHGGSRKKRICLLPGTGPQQGPQASEENLRDKALYLLFDRFLGNKAHDLIDHLAILKEQQRRNTTNAKP